MWFNQVDVHHVADLLSACWGWEGFGCGAGRAVRRGPGLQLIRKNPWRRWCPSRGVQGTQTCQEGLSLGVILAVHRTINTWCHWHVSRLSEQVLALRCSVCIYGRDKGRKEGRNVVWGVDEARAERWLRQRASLGLWRSHRVFVEHLSPARCFACSWDTEKH